MPVRDIVVIGGSAGGIEAVQRVLGSMPPGLPAAVFVAVHLSPRGKSFLAKILDRHGALPAHEAANGARIEPGHVYVAPPDRHLMIAEDHIHLTRGPKEGLHRPSINVMFRSAASTYGPRVIGILLSGMLDDGAAGLWEIARHGGTAIVQDPAEAAFPSMPMNALQDAKVDFTLRAAEIGKVVGQIVNEEMEIPDRDDPGQEPVPLEFSGFTCPECRGPLYTKKKPGPLEFRCRVGHVISFDTLMDEDSSMQERKLYEAMVALQEGADLAELAAGRVTGGEREAFMRESAQLHNYADTIRLMIERREVPSVLRVEGGSKLPKRGEVA